MTQIKSEKAREYARKIHPLHDLSEITLRVTDLAFIAECDFMAGYELAETEAEERHAAELQALKDKAVDMLASVCPNLKLGKYDNTPYQCDKICDYIKLFTQKLNEK